MKKFLLTLTAIFICTIAYAHTINWHVGDTILETTTCDSGESITPPTAPYKYGFHFVKWIDYRPIEYLEHTESGPYIDTGIKPNQDTRVVTSFISTSTDGCAPFGARNGPSNNSFFIHLSTSNSLLDYGSQRDTSQTNSYFFNDIVNVDFNKNILNLINTKTVRSYTKTFIYSTFQSKYNLLIFALNNAGDTGWGCLKLKVYYFQIYDNDVLVRDFIPVLDKDGVPCMYDKVEKKFYYNAGTGQFVAGPVIGE